MLYLKAANLEDEDKEYEAIIKFPEDENGFKNQYFNVSKEKFKNDVLPKLINNAKGIDLKEGWVPCTYYFLWKDEEIVGLYKVRHCLNERLKKEAGHIGYGIIKEYRGKGYATEGLRLAIEELKKITNDNEIYLFCNTDNIASLKAQPKNGAYIVKQDKSKTHTRIKIKSE